MYQCLIAVNLCGQCSCKTVSGAIACRSHLIKSCAPLLCSYAYLSDRYLPPLDLLEAMVCRMAALTPKRATAAMAAGLLYCCTSLGVLPPEPATCLFNFVHRCSGRQHNAPVRMPPWPAVLLHQPGRAAEKLNNTRRQLLSHYPTATTGSGGRWLIN